MPINMGVSFVALTLGISLPNIARYWIPRALDYNEVGDGSTFARRAAFLTQFSSNQSTRYHWERLGVPLIPVAARNRPAWMRCEELENTSLYTNIRWKAFDIFTKDKHPEHLKQQKKDSSSLENSEAEIAKVIA